MAIDFAEMRRVIGPITRERMPKLFEAYDEIFRKTAEQLGFESDGQMFDYFYNTPKLSSILTAANEAHSNIYLDKAKCGQSLRQVILALEEHLQKGPWTIRA